MKRKRFTETQIIGILKEAEQGVPVTDLCRKHSMSNATFYAWRKKYAGMNVAEAKRLRQLEDENRRLKKIVADQALDIDMLKAVNAKKIVRPGARKRVVHWVVKHFKVSERHACRLFELHRSTKRYCSRRKEPPELRAALREVAYAHPRFGDRRVHWLLERRGFLVGQRRVRRIYREEGLTVRRRKRIVREPATLPTRPNDRWSMDFVHDQFDYGRWYRVFTAVDDFTRESVAMEAATSLPSAKVTEVLDRAIARRGGPRRIVCDNGSEFTSLWFMQWAARHGIDIQFIQPGKPTQNPYAESFNGRFRDECLNTHWFSTLPQAQLTIAQWQHHYNAERPHGALGKKPLTSSD